MRLPASKEDNRLSQQRSRARQREYVASLERRIGEYERRGVHATMEVQCAARAVAVRNEKLLALLALHGVQQEEIDAFLEGPETAAAASSVPPPGLALAMRPLGARIGTGSPAQQEVMGGVDRGQPDKTEKLTVSNNDVHACNPFGESRTRDATANEATCMNSTSEMTSCDTAATIIVNLRGHGDIVEARQALGCASSAPCSVKNTHLFQLMDEMP